VSEPFKIENDIPLPSRDRRSPRWEKYPWAKMEVGQSILCMGDDEKNGPASAYSYGKRHGIAFTQKRTSAGVRIWRIK